MRERDDLQGRVEELADTLAALEQELDRRGRRPPGRRLLRFTREVTIPAVILLLRTNIEALRLLQRTLSMADESDRADAADAADRVGRAGESALDGLASALEEVGEALSGRPTDDRARELLTEARELRREVEADLDRETGRDAVDIDVESELRSIKDDVEDDRGGEG